MGSSTYQTIESTEILVEGTVLRVVFRKPENGFSILKVQISDTANKFSLVELTIIGESSPTIGSGTSIVARGRYEKHQKFGEQFRAFSILEQLPTTSEGLLRYLSSGSIKGFGEVLAGRALELFGMEIIAVLDSQPHRLREVPGIGKKKLEEIISSWKEIRGDKETQLFFSQLGLSQNLIQKIIRRFGNRSQEKVRENPYLLADELLGVGFQTADKIALSMGIDPFSDQRLAATLEYIIKQSADDGHTYLPEQLLLEKAARQIGCDDREKLSLAIDRASLEGRIVIEKLREGRVVYTLALHRCELVAAKKVKEMLTKSLPIIRDEFVTAAAGKQYLASTSDSRVIHLSPEQKQALYIASRSSLTVITGGPGCGKTTLVRALVSLFRTAGLIIKLAAPTGRAAQRLSDVCEHEATTIHRLLKYDPMTRTFVHSEEEPIECDVLMIDESSMLDISLASSLLSSLPKTARVIFIGDADQLPSVGPGLFFRELLEIADKSTVRLTTLFRRANESLISVAAHQINSGEVPEIPEPDGKVKADAYFLPIRDAVEGAALIEKLVSDQIPKKFGYSGTEITVLTPMNQGELGALALNRRLQERLLPSTLGVPTLKAGGLEYRLGDRICQRVNNYQLGTTGVFNGEQGEITGVDQYNLKLFVRLWDGREIEYSKELFSQIDLAYAISIHRSQGSEIPVVILALHDSQTILLERQLLYTAVTRAKKLLIIVATKRALIMAVRKTRSQRRYSGLLLRFRGEI